MTMNMKPNNNKPLLILLCLLLCMCLPAYAEASASLYKVIVSVPGEWTNADTIDMTLRVELLTETPLEKLEYNMDGSWQDVTDSFKNAPDGRISIQIAQNTQFRIRMTAPDGKEYTEEKEIRCFDREAPKVQASIKDNNLVIVTTDQLSGTAGIQVNGLLFTSVDRDVLTIPMTTLKNYENLMIRVFDYAGNFTDPLALSNTFYDASVSPTFMPNETAGTKPGAAVTPVPAATNTPAAASQNYPHGSSSIYLSDRWPYESVTSQPMIPSTTPEPIIQTEYITLGPGMPFKSEGNSHTLDMLYSASTNKQFVSLQTKAGNTFYLVIDYDKPIDAEAELYETYFLNLVDDRDLAALLSDEEQEELPTATPQIIYVTPKPTAAPVPTDIPDEPDKDNGSSQTAGILALAGLLGICGAGAYMLIKKKKNTAQPDIDNDFEMEDEPDDSESHE